MGQTTKTTPTHGPWYVGAQNDGLYVIDRPPRPSNDDINPDADVRVIAKVYRPDGGDPGEEDSNGRLLAAAPDLYLAARMMVEAPHDSGRHHAYAALTKAIAKAEGKATD